MEKNEAAVEKIDDGETEIHYRGWKAMPFVIGELCFVCFVFLYFVYGVYSLCGSSGFRE